MVDPQMFDLGAGDRALLKGVRGRRLAWLSPNGTLDRDEVWDAEVFEVPRCFRGATDDPEWIARNLAAYPGFTVSQVCGFSWPRAVGVAMVIREPRHLPPSGDVVVEVCRGS